MNLPENELAWFPFHGYGICTAKPKSDLYDKPYWDKYRLMADTPIGHELVAKRVELVNRHIGNGALLDYGVGSGAFVEARPNTFGFDVNPHARAWLMCLGLWRDLAATPFKLNVSMFDTFEHIEDHGPVLDIVDEYLFMTIPIFRNANHARWSKHYRCGEHVWYFSEWGLVKYMAERGFECVERNRMEEDAGRESVGTFVWRRK